MSRRPPRPITPVYLERVVAHYLKRHFTTRAHLRRLLMQRVRRSVAHHGGGEEDGARQVDALLDRLVDTGVLDDAAYAASVARSMRRRGASGRAIRAKLGSKGLRGDAVDEALAAATAEDDGGADPDLVAAVRWARKKRLGPWCLDEELRAERREKDLARLGRRGFSFGIARQVIDGDPGELEELL